MSFFTPCCIIPLLFTQSVALFAYLTSGIRVLSQFESLTNCIKMAIFSRVIIALALIFFLEITAQQVTCPFGYYLQTERSTTSYNGCLPCPPGTTGKYGVFDNNIVPTGSNGEALLKGGTCLTCPGREDRFYIDLCSLHFYCHTNLPSQSTFLIILFPYSSSLFTHSH